MENQSKVYIAIGAGVAVFAAVAYAAYKVGQSYSDDPTEDESNALMKSGNNSLNHG